MKTKLFPIIVLTLLTTGLVFSPVQGQEASPGAEEDLEEKVQSIRDAVKEKVQEKLEEAKKRAFVGEMTEISNSTLTLKIREGEKQIKVNEEATIIDLERKEIELGDLEIGSFLIAMGYVEETGILDARRLVVTEKPEGLPQTVAFGEVTDKSTEENVLTVKHPRKGTVWSVEVLKKTTITKKGEDKPEELDFDEIEVGDRVVAIGETDTKENFITAKIIQVIISASPTPEPEE